MMERQIHRTRVGGGEGDGAAPAPAPAPAAEQDFTAVLNEIDDILEENALAFVQGFIQEGGE